MTLKGLCDHYVTRRDFVTTSATGLGGVLFGATRLGVVGKLRLPLEHLIQN